VTTATNAAELEKRFELVAENAPVMLWMGDAEGHCLYLNRLQREFWGVAPEGITQFDWGTTVHPEDRDLLYAPFARAMQDHKAFTLEARYRRVDGEFRLLRTDAHPRFAADGTFTGMIGVNVDVTELRRAETALREETRALEILNRSGATVAAERDLERIVQAVTDAGVALSGAQFGAFFYNVTNAAGESYMLYSLSGVPREAFSKFPMPRATKVFEPTFKGEGIVRSDDIQKDPRYGHNAPHAGMPPGHLPVRSYLAVPVHARSGEVLGGLFFGHAEPGKFNERSERVLSGLAAQTAIAVDNARLFQAAEREIAQRRAAEDELHQLNESLARKVAAGIDQLRLSEEELRQAQKMEAVGKLTGGVAHDFNNLLQVIGGNLHLLVKDVAGNDRAEQRVHNALAAVARGARLSTQLLAFGRRQALDPKVINLSRLVRRLDDMLRRALGEGVEIETVVAGGLWNTFADATQVETALLNLSFNARDAMGGQGRLTIEAGNAFLDDSYAARHSDVKAGQYVMLAVTDTGSGMSPEVVDRAFEPFFTTKPEGQGTGLGLSQVYGFVKQSGGHVKIYSEPGQGTTIRIYLPRSLAAEDAPPAPHAGPVTGGTETILVVEDDESVRATVVELLTELGYRVLKAKDAASALIVVESGVAIDLLFTDVVMPGTMRSTELARKARERLPDIAVLFTSGYTENAIVHGGRLDAGVNLLSKPYSREMLAAKIREVLRPSLDRRTTPAPGPAAGNGALRILVVEDEPLIRMNTVEMLTALKHSVLEAADAGAAQEILKRETIDVLLTDVSLAGMSGRELAILACARDPKLCVVFASGHAFDAPPHPVLKGRFASLVKPYDEAGLERALEQATAPPR